MKSSSFACFIARTDCGQVIRLLILALSCASLFSCSTFYRVAIDPHPVLDEVKPHTRVEIRTASGEWIRSALIDSIDHDRLLLRVNRKRRKVYKDSIRFMEIRSTGTRMRTNYPIKGEMVTVTLRDGRIIKCFTVTSFDSTLIKGKSDCGFKDPEIHVFQRSEIAAIETVQKFDGQRLVLLKKKMKVEVTLRSGKVIKHLKVIDFDSCTIRGK